MRRGRSIFLQEKISAIHVDPEALIQGGEGAQGGNKPLIMSSSWQMRPSQGDQGQGWSSGCRDGERGNREVSQVKGRPSAEVRLSSSSRPWEGEPQAPECSGRERPRAEPEQIQASWCWPEAVLPITELPGLQRKDLLGKREKR